MTARRWKLGFLLVPALALNLLIAGPAQAAATIDVSPAQMALGSNSLPTFAAIATPDSGYSMTGSMSCTAPVSSSSDAGTYTISCSQDWVSDTDPNDTGTATGTGVLTIPQENLTITGVNISSKQYDGDNSATISGCTYSGAAIGHIPSCSGTATFDATAVGTQSVTITSVDITSHANDYVVSSSKPTTATGAITAKSVTVTVSASASDKEYDGSASASGAVDSCTVNGTVGSDTVTCTGSPVEFSSAAVGTNKQLTVSGISLGGPDAGNYDLASTTATSSSTASITPKIVSIGSITIADHQYDGGTSASISGCTISGSIGGDTVSCTGSASFQTASIGNSKTVDVTGITLSGADAGNYTLDTNTYTATGAIIQKVLTASVSVSGTKVYDGTTAPPAGYTITGCDISAGVVAGEDVACTVSSASATFETKDVGSNKAMVVNGLSLTGANAGNYTLSTSASSSASITPATTNATVGTGTKVYDGSLTAPVSCTFDVTFGSDVLSCVATLPAKDVGNYSVSAISLSGTDAGNYSLGTVTSGSVTVSKATLTPYVSIASKVYDGSTVATIIGCTFGSSVATADGVFCDYSTATARFATATIGANKVVTVTGLQLGGTGTGNFALATTPVTGRADIVTSLGTTNPIPVTITAVDTTAYSGLGLPPLQFRVSIANVLTILPTCTAYNGSTPLTNADVEGTFVIKCADAVALPTYAITYVDATLRIVPDDGTHAGVAPLATFQKPVVQRVPATASILVRAQVFAADGRLLTVSVSVPKGASPTDLNLEIAPARLLPDLLGYTSIRVVARDLAGKEVSSFNKPIVITVPAGATSAIPAWSLDDDEWTPIPKLPAASLPSGAADGYFVESDGSITIFTTHFTIFALQALQPALTVQPKKKAKTWVINKSLSLLAKGGGGEGQLTYVSLTKSVCSFAKSTVGTVKTKKVGRCIIIVRKAGNRQFFDAVSTPLLMIVKKSANAAAPGEAAAAGTTAAAGKWKSITGLPKVQVIGGTAAGTFVLNIGSAATKTVAATKAKPIAITLTGLAKNTSVSPMVIGPNGVASYLASAVVTKTGSVKLQVMRFLAPGTYRILIRTPGSATARLVTLRVV